MELQELARQVGTALKTHQIMLATAESCTGGWVAREITAIPGSSHWFDRGFVTYTNLSKQQMLGVSAETIKSHGAVSEQAVREMAEGAIQYSQAKVSVAISGIAGPGGGSEDKPVGTVCLAWAKDGIQTYSKTEYFQGDRESVREQAVMTALQGLLDILNGNA
jgi:nicotinamide-nucleotide amidase